MIATLRAAFARDAFVDLTALFDADVRSRVAGEVIAALDAHGARRDLRVPATGDSPRRYRIAARDALVAACPLASALYRSDELRERIAAVAGEPVVAVPYVPEELIATRLETAGDTHGWHWDDYGFALVWVLRAPLPGHGGELEYIAGLPWCKSEPRLDALLAEHDPVRVQLPAGSVYLLRTDTTLHRVTPLRCAGVRDALCFSYAAERERSRAVSHETLEAILDAPPPDRRLIPA